MGKNIHSTHRKVEITRHAKQRLKERCPNVLEKDYDSFVRSARYSGVSLDSPQLPDDVRGFVKTRFRYNNSCKLKVYKGCVFVFVGQNHHARVLRTVVKLPDNIIEKYNLENFKINYEN